MEVANDKHKMKELWERITRLESQQERGRVRSTCLQFDANSGFQKLKQSREYTAHLEREIRELRMASERFDLLEEDWKEHCKLFRENWETDEGRRCEEGFPSNYLKIWPKTREEFIDLQRSLMNENVSLRASVECCRGDISSLRYERDLLRTHCQVLQLQRENPHLQPMLAQVHEIQGGRRISSKDCGNLQLSFQSMPMKTCEIMHSSFSRSTEERSAEQATTSTYHHFSHSMSSSHVSSQELAETKRRDCDDHRTGSLKPAT
jgi:hypothetical protein